MIYAPRSIRGRRRLGHPALFGVQDPGGGEPGEGTQVNAIYFGPGETTYLQRTTDLPPEHPFTLCGWVRLDNVDSAVPSWIATAITASDVLWDFLAVRQESGTDAMPRVATPVSPEGWADIPGFIAPGQWYFLVMVLRDDDTYSLHAMAEGGSSLTTVTRQYEPVGDPATVLRIGSNRFGLDVAQWAGGLAHFYAYTAALSAGQLLQQAQQVDPVDPTNLYEHWPMQSHTTAGNGAVNGRHLTLTGTVTTGTGPTIG